MTQFEEQLHDPGETGFGLSWWYAAHGMFGAVQLVALPLLIPPFVLALTDSLAHTGGVWR